MFLKNLLRRKIRTSLTVIGIAIGVAAIIGLGAMADGMEVGYNSMLTGSKADLIVSQPDAVDPTYSAVDEKISEQLAAMPEVKEVSGMIQGFANAEGQPFLFVFGYPKGSFVLDKFHIIDGTGLDNPKTSHGRGKPLVLGSAAAEVLHKKAGDSLRVVNSVYRIVGIYETGDTFEDSGILMDLPEAQELTGKPHQVSLIYVRLKDASLQERFTTRFQRQFKNLEVSGAKEFADKQIMKDMLRGYVWAIGGLAIVIGGVGMMNAQLMSVMERTREIGTLRAVGWSKRRVMWMILMESLSVSILGGLLGIGLGYLALVGLSQITVFMGTTTTTLQPDLLIQAFFVVFTLGLVGGLYPAWRASRMQPVEALRYEGGSGGSKVRRLPIGGMAAQSLVQRTGRTMLTLSVIGITVGAIIALQSIINGFVYSFADLLGSSSEIMLRQADISDTEFSVIDERVGEKIAALPEVKGVSGIIFTAVMMPDAGGFFILWGYAPNEFAIQRFKIVEGEPLTNNHQIILGRFMAEALNRKVGDTIELSGVRFRVVGIFESNTGWEEVGGVISLRDAQVFTGRPRKVAMNAIKLYEPSQASDLVNRINREYPGIHASLASEFVNQMPDMQTIDGLMGGISFLSILIGGVGVLNTMLMAVFERTREIGVMRALGWRRRAVLGLVLREALLLGFLGGITGILVAFGLAYLLMQIPALGGYLEPSWDLAVFARAIFIALFLGLIGGLYPAYRATRLQPIEALRYE